MRPPPILNSNIPVKNEYNRQPPLLHNPSYSKEPSILSNSPYSDLFTFLPKIINYNTDSQTWEDFTKILQITLNKEGNEDVKTLLQNLILKPKCSICSIK